MFIYEISKSQGNASYPLEKKEEGLLERLQAVPPEEVESRAKANGEWHAGGSEHVPAVGDLAVFSLEGNRHALRTGIVKGFEADGNIRVLTGNASATETRMIKEHQIHGYISSPRPNKPNFVGPLTRFFGSHSQELESHKRLIHLMSGLLLPNPDPAFDPHSAQDATIDDISTIHFPLAPMP